MNTLQNKANKLLWMTKCEESFQKLKQILTTTPILRIVDHDGDFLVCTNVSKEGLCGCFVESSCKMTKQSVMNHKN